MRPLGIATVLALAAASILGGTAAASEQRPMRGEFTITIAATNPRCGDALTLGFDGVGLATHLGQLTGVASHCTEFTLFTQAVPLWDGVATFTAADGSTISTNYSGWQGTPVGGLAEVSSTHTIVGGSGRFAAAAGTWTLNNVIDFTTGSATGSLSGWLSY